MLRHMRRHHHSSPVILTLFVFPLLWIHWSSSATFVSGRCWEPGLNSNSRFCPVTRKGVPEAATTSAVSQQECVPGLRDWLWAVEIERHYEAVNTWCYEMGAASFSEVAENAVDLAEYLGDALNEEERRILTRGAV